MAENSAISWTDHTMNPWIGCQKVGPGCDHCYAETLMDTRYHKVQWGPGQERMRTSAANWKLPLKWNRRAEIMASGWAAGVNLYGSEEACVAAGHLKPRRPRVFCASLADVFDNEVPPQWRGELWGLIRTTPHLDWLLLTKRIGNALGMLPADWGDGYSNVWLGATVVNQEEADRDIPKLLATPARVRFLSVEPMLGPIDLRTVTMPDGDELGEHLIHAAWDRIDWVIVGGESGAQARPMHPDWARALRDQCAAAGVAFHLKQWGEWWPISQMPDGRSDELSHRAKVVLQFDGRQEFAFPVGAMTCFKTGKADSGRLLDGVEHNGFPS